MKRSRSSRASRGAAIRQQLRHVVCSQFSQSGVLTAAQCGLNVDRPARPVSLQFEMASSVAATVQISIHAGDGSVTFVSPIYVVGTNSRTGRFKIPFSEFDRYGAQANVINVSIGSRGVGVFLAFTATLVMHYGDQIKSLC